MANININGVNITGNAIRVINGRVIVDGNTIDIRKEDKIVNVTVTGNMESLSVDVAESIRIQGDVNTVKSTSGDIDITGNVGGSVQTVSGDVNCGNVTGGVKTVSGDINRG